MYDHVSPSRFSPLQFDAFVQSFHLLDKQIRQMTDSLTGDTEFQGILNFENLPP